MEISMQTRPFNKMRYPTAGDFLYHPGIDLFRYMIAEMKETDYEALIFLHEFIESYLCWKAGIREEAITAFDIAFEKSGADGEPGDSKDAPYYSQHQIATKFEKKFAKEIGVSWKKYDKAINALFG
jgi:hypothetical protein